MRKELLLSHFIGVETKPRCCKVIFLRPQSQDTAAECLTEGRQAGVGGGTSQVVLVIKNLSAMQEMQEVRV